MDRLKEIFLWWNEFDDKDIIIKSENKEFNIKILKENLPHLLGLQYINNNKRINAGKIINDILTDKLSYKDVEKRVYVNNEKYLINVEDRISTFRNFMENIDKAYVVEQTHEKTKLKSQYLIIDIDSDSTKHLGIYETGGLDYMIDFNVLETYIVQKNNNYYKSTNIKEPVEEILFYEEEIGEYRPGSFNLEKDYILRNEALGKYEEDISFSKDKKKRVYEEFEI